MRTEYAVSTIIDNGVEVEKLAYGIANWNRAQAQTKMTQMLAEYDGEIELVIANNDDMVGTVYNDKEGQAQAMLDLAYALSVGDTLDDLNLENGKYIRLPYSKVGSRDVKNYMK